VRHYNYQALLLLHKSQTGPDCRRPGLRKKEGVTVSDCLLSLPDNEKNSHIDQREPNIRTQPPSTGPVKRGRTSAACLRMSEGKTSREARCRSKASGQRRAGVKRRHELGEARMQARTRKQAGWRHKQKPTKPSPDRERPSEGHGVIGKRVRGRKSDLNAHRTSDKTGRSTAPADSDGRGLGLGFLGGSVTTRAASTGEEKKYNGSHDMESHVHAQAGHRKHVSAAMPAECRTPRRPSRASLSDAASRQGHAGSASRRE